MGCRVRPSETYPTIGILWGQGRMDAKETVDECSKRREDPEETRPGADPTPNPVTCTLFHPGPQTGY